MDNVTHTLVGALIGARFTLRAEHDKRSIIAASILANNFPDADVFYARFLSQPLGYLLHHRGHTHTILGAIVCGILCWLAVSALSLLRHKRMPRDSELRVLAVSLLGTFAHLLLDALNSYGVHPFWPIDNSWYYGDTLFIIEPMLWITLSAAVIVTPALERLRWAALLLTSVAAALIAFSGYVPPQIYLFFLAFLLALLMLGFRRGSLGKQRIWHLASVAIVLLFAACGRAAVSQHSKIHADERVLVSFAAPSPANPLCWSAFRILLARDAVRYERRLIQPVEFILPFDCSEYSLARDTTQSPGSSMSWEIPLSTFQSLAANCRWRAFLKFARTPIIEQLSNGVQVASDLRFSRRRKRSQVKPNTAYVETVNSGFASVPLEGDCPKDVPPWESPVPFTEISEFH